MEIVNNSTSESETLVNVDSNVSTEENSESFANEENIEVQEQSEMSTSTSTEIPQKENLHQAKKKLLKLPMSRVKYIMKMDPDVTIVSQDAVFLVTKATEFFLEYLGREAAAHSQTMKRKTMNKRDVEIVIEKVANLCFLDGALD